MKTTVDPQEVAKFAQHANQWWNLDGPLKTLHDINPVRLDFMSKFTLLNDKSVLDVGCGGGILSEGMALQGANVIGLDVEPEAVAAAIKHAQVNQLSVEYVCQSIEAFSAGPFDIITCMEMLEHVPDPRWVIEHMARLLKPGGLLFLSTINRTVQAYTTAILAAEYLLKILPRQTHDFEKFIKPSELYNLVRKTGFEIIGLKGLGYNPLTRKATLQDSVAVNYLLACRKLGGLDKAA